MGSRQSLLYATVDTCKRCRKDAACTLTRWQHFSVWNDAMSTILKVRRHIKIRLRQSTHMYLKNNRAKIPEPWAFSRSIATTRVMKWDRFLIQSSLFVFPCDENAIWYMFVHISSVVQTRSQGSGGSGVLSPSKYVLCRRPKIALAPRKNYLTTCLLCFCNCLC